MPMSPDFTSLESRVSAALRALAKRDQDLEKGAEKGERKKMSKRGRTASIQYVSRQSHFIDAATHHRSLLEVKIFLIRHEIPRREVIRLDNDDGAMF